MLVRALLLPERVERRLPGYRLCAAGGTVGAQPRTRRQRGGTALEYQQSKYADTQKCAYRQIFAVASGRTESALFP